MTPTTHARQGNPPRLIPTRLVVDRLERAITDAGLTLPQAIILCQTVLPEAFADRPPGPRSDVPPGRGKVRVYAERAADRCSLFRGDEPRLADLPDDDAPFHTRCESHPEADDGEQ